jgi:hypothetical protein
MLDREASPVAGMEPHDESTSIAGPAMLFGDELTSLSGAASSIQDFVGIDQAAEVEMPSPRVSPETADVSPTTVPTNGTVKRAAFLVAHWLVGQGEG